jgi:hypothetical protein
VWRFRIRRGANATHRQTKAETEEQQDQRLKVFQEWETNLLLDDELLDEELEDDEDDE